MLTSQSTSSLLKGHFSFYATLTRPAASGGSGLSQQALRHVVQANKMFPDGDPAFFLDLRFTDSSGIRWVRASNGALSQTEPF